MTIRVATSQEIFDSLEVVRGSLDSEWRKVVYETTEISPEDVEVLWQCVDVPSEVSMILTVDFVSGTIVHNFDMLRFFLHSEFVRAVLREKVPRMKIMFAGGLVADREVEN